MDANYISLINNNEIKMPTLSKQATQQMEKDNILHNSYESADSAKETISPRMAAQQQPIILEAFNITIPTIKMCKVTTD